MVESGFNKPSRSAFHLATCAFSPHHPQCVNMEKASTACVLEKRGKVALVYPIRTGRLSL